MVRFRDPAPVKTLTSGCSSVVERALWEREAAGSSPVTPTKRVKLMYLIVGRFTAT